MNPKEILDAIESRHSVRSYTNRLIQDYEIQQIEKLLEELNQKSGISFHLMQNEPRAFSNWMARYGKFSNVSNYIVISAPDKSASSQQLAGYYGEKAVLALQHMGLNTCWAALTFKKESKLWNLAPGWKVICLIALGYGTTQGVLHHSKETSQVSNLSQTSPEWFKNGVKAAMLAPTAVNQQKFYLRLENDKVAFENKGGFYRAIDEGIVRYHFEQGSRKGPQVWAG